MKAITDLRPMLTMMHHHWSMAACLFLIFFSFIVLVRGPQGKRSSNQHGNGELIESCCILLWLCLPYCYCCCCGCCHSQSEPHSTLFIFKQRRILAVKRPSIGDSCAAIVYSKWSRNTVIWRPTKILIKCKTSSNQPTLSYIYKNITH